MAKSNNIREALSGHLLKDKTLDAVRLGLLTSESLSEVYRFTDEAQKTKSKGTASDA